MCSPEAALVMEGVADGKKITSETQRRLLYEQLIKPIAHTTADVPTASDPMNMWAIAVIDGATIDERNALQATLLDMRMVASVMTGRAIKYPTVYINEFESEQTLPGCFVLVPNGVPLQEQLPMDTERGQYQFVDHRIML